jgi:hypothetical protein
MLPRFLAILTLAATLLHSVLGCCWHHEHVAAKSSPPEKAVCHRHGCAHHRHPAKTTESPEPCEHGDGHCHEPSCVYLVARHFELPPASTSDVLFTVEMSQLELAAAESSVLRPLVMPPSRPAAPELRALLQVWLI